jgi:hypothetical protein
MKQGPGAGCRERRSKLERLARSLGPWKGLSGQMIRRGTSGRRNSYRSRRLRLAGLTLFHCEVLSIRSSSRPAKKFELARKVCWGTESLANKGGLTLQQHNDNRYVYVSEAGLNDTLMSQPQFVPEHVLGSGSSRVLRSYSHTSGDACFTQRWITKQSSDLPTCQPLSFNQSALILSLQGFVLSSQQQITHSFACSVVD